MTTPTQAANAILVRGLTDIARSVTKGFVFTGDKAGEVASMLNAGDALADELDRRSKEDPATRLHNVCEAIAEQADGSEFSREEWERIDAEIARLRAANAALTEALKDAHELLSAGFPDSASIRLESALAALEG